MAKKKRNLTEIGRVIAIILEGVSGMIDRLCDRSERRAGLTPEATPEQDQQVTELVEEFE